MISNDALAKELALIEGVVLAEVTGDGYHYHVLIVSDLFQGKTKVARQQWVYAQLKEHITSGRLHAVNMQTFTQDEWEKQRG